MDYRQLSRGILRQIIGLLVKIKLIFPATHYALLSLLFIVGLELIFALQQWVVWVALLVVIIVIIGVMLVRFEEKATFQGHQAILPIMATIGLSGYGFFLPTSWLLHAYIIGSGIILSGKLIRYGIGRFR